LKLHIQAENLSLSDPVTGVHNRRFFELLVKRELNRCRRYNRGLTLILVQFDGWKEYCATKELLHSIPQILKDCVRRNTDVIGRFSSDTFAILLPETDPEGSRNLAEAIRRKVGELEEIRGKIEIHIGITTAEAESRCGDVDTLFYCADRTLNRAKSSGRICEDVIRFAVQKNPNAECASSLQGD
jgi:diguanylate cyclase (GGDEF)-like protein